MLTLPEHGPRDVAGAGAGRRLWALRLFVYITWRNWGEAEDRRYQAIRANNQPNFEFKSLYIVFGLQAVIAWIVSLPLLDRHRRRRFAWSARSARRGAVAGRHDVRGRRRLPAGPLQGRSGQSRPGNGSRSVALYASSQLFRQCLYLVGFRPDCRGCRRLVGADLADPDDLPVAQGVGRIAAGSDIGERRPAYADYRARTNAFIPGPPKKTTRSVNGVIIMVSNACARALRAILGIMAFAGRLTVGRAERIALQGFAQ